MQVVPDHALDESVDRISGPAGAGPGLAIACAFAAFSAVVLFAASRMPMSYDDAFNATLPLSLARGTGYASQFGATRPFDPSVSSGAAFLAPAALPIAAFGPHAALPMLYTSAVCLALYLCLLLSLYAHEPRAALATAALVPFMLWQGKNDPIVGGDILPAAPFGYWYQLLGNLPGLLALALAVSLLLERRPATAIRRAAVLALAVFAVNAKLMHAVPLVAMAATWLALPAETGAPPLPRRGRFAMALALLAAGWCGYRLNRALAWTFVDGTTFATFAATETEVIGRTSGAARLSSIPLSAMAGLLVGNIAEGARGLLALLGGGLQVAAMIAGLAATAVLGWRRSQRSPLARLAVVFTAGAAAHVAWWFCLSGLATRRLTPVAGLACFALGCGFGLWWQEARLRPRAAVWLAVLALFCTVGVPNLLHFGATWRRLREHRGHQLAATAALERIAAKYPDAAFCAPGWWVPRELTYLAPSGTRWCNLKWVAPDVPGRRILMRSTNLWPLEHDEVRAAEGRCTVALERVGRFELRACDRFIP